VAPIRYRLFMRGVLRQLLLGAAAAGVTYLIGHLANTTASPLGTRKPCE
jgi:VIT1/CCC1 family predicted Fe2+/Mn2+ transporter